LLIHESKGIKNLNANRIFYRLGEAYAKQQDYYKAATYYHKSLVASKPDFSDSLNLHQNPSLQGNVYDEIHFLEVLREKARMLSFLPNNLQNLESSLSTYLLAIAWTDSLRHNYVLEDNELFWSESFNGIYEEAIHIAYRLYEKMKAPAYRETAFRLSEKSKSILLFEAFATNIGRHNTSVPREMLEKERDLAIDIAYYEKTHRQALRDQDTAKAILLKNYLRDSRITLASLKENMERSYPDYYRLKYPDQDFNIRYIQQYLLDQHTAVIEYFIGREWAYAFVLSKDELQMIPLQPPDSIEQHLLRLSSELFDTHSFIEDPKRSTKQFNAIAFEAYGCLLQQALQKAGPDIDKLIIVPDEGLNALPFEVLNTQLKDDTGSNFGGLPYLLKDFQIQYAYSIKLLQKNRERHLQLSPNTQCLAFAPVYERNKAQAILDVRSSQLRNGITVLEHTAGEIEAIGQHFDGLFLASPEATKANFMQRAQDYGILHLAMHGEADFQNTKFGHLIFSNADTSSLEDNLLYHYEIANLELNAQLAVLSACETGVGKYQPGEGVFSLARSFMYAGVPSIVMSLWKVNDRSTSQIMPLYYEKLAHGTEKNQALRAAKLEYLETAGLAFRHPFYWASFVALGDQQALQKPFPWKPIVAGLAILLLFFLGFTGYKITGKNNTENY